MTLQNVALDPRLAEAIDPEEYARLLMWPRQQPFSPDVERGAAEARSWYARNGSPFVATRRLDVKEKRGRQVIFEAGAVLEGAALAESIERAGSRSVVAAAASAGAEVDREVTDRWQEERVDEAYFLDRFAAAVVEHLLHRLRVQLCRRFEPEGLSVASPISPGFAGWPLEDQLRLMAVVSEGTALRALSSGMLTPRHSILSVFVMTREPAKKQVVPCHHCSYSPCSYRRGRSP